MTPEEKGAQIVKKFEDENYFSNEDILLNAKHNALICVNELIEATDYTQDYWIEVKSYIESI